MVDRLHDSQFESCMAFAMRLGLTIELAKWKATSRGVLRITCDMERDCVGDTLSLAMRIGDLHYYDTMYEYYTILN